MERPPIRDHSLGSTLQDPDGVLYAGKQKLAVMGRAVVSGISPRKLVHCSFNLLEKVLTVPHILRSPDLLVDLKRA